MPAMAPTRRSRIVPVEDALEELRAGRMIVLMDDEDRENEGDLCVAAERVTAEHINFMATYGRGLICLALTEERCEQLGLAMMTRENRAPLGTAFTVSIDARQGIGRGISAIDRATTIRTAVRPDATPADLVTPGHVFPLRARRGGVLVRAGQTEGSVDLARLAGFEPAGVICEIMREDGTMARLPDLEAFAERHDLKIVTIASLIEYRIRRDSLVHRVAEAPLETRAGGEFRPGDVFGYRDRDTRGLLHRAMARIAAEGRGVILYLRRPDRFDLVTAGAAAGTPPSTGDPGLPRSSTFREFGIGAQILRDIGVGKIRWLTNTPLRLVSLPGYGLEIVEYVPLAAAGETAPASEPHAGRLRTRR